VRVARASAIDGKTRIRHAPVTHVEGLSDQKVDPDPLAALGPHGDIHDHPAADLLVLESLVWLPPASGRAAG
jgi:hypothetical protein